MPAPITDAANLIEGNVVSDPSDESINEKTGVSINNEGILKDGTLVQDSEVADTPVLDDSDQDSGSEHAIIVTGSDAAKHLLPLRDDGQPALTFRSLFLATVLSAFQAVMSQIYTVS